MSTAYAGSRSKEIGLRKVVGARRHHLVLQFLGETALLVGLAMICTLGLVSGIWPVFESFTGIPLLLETDFLYTVTAGFVIAAVSLMLLAGAYPAFYLSRYQPQQALKDHKLQVSGNERVRQFLVGFQFFMVIVLMSSLILMEKQFSFMSERNLGFEQENLMVIEVNGGGVRNHFQQIKTSLLEHPAISNVSGFSRVVSGEREPRNITVNPSGNTTDQFAMDFYGMDEDASLHWLTT